MHDIAGVWIRQVTKKRAWVVGITLVCSIVCGLGLTHLTFSPDNRLFFDEDDPQRRVLESLENTFTRANNLILILTPVSGDVFSEEVLEALDTMSEAAWRIPHATRVESLANFQVVQGEDDDILVSDLVNDAVTLTATQRQEIKRLALSEPHLVGRLVSTRGDVAAIEVLINNPGSKLDEVPRIAAAARDLTHRFAERYPQIVFRISGGIMADATFAEAGRRDITLLVPVMILVVCLMVWLGTRSLLNTLLVVVVVVIAVVISLGAAGFSGVVLNSASSAAPVMIMTLCIADCIHIFTTYASVRHAGKSHDEAIEESFCLNLFPVFLTSATTAIGFLALNFSQSPPLRDLGNMVATGVMAGFLLSCTFFPAMLFYYRQKVDRLFLVDGATIAKVGRLSLRYRRSLAFMFLSIVALSLTGISRINLDDDFVKYFDNSFHFRADSDYMQAHLGGLHVLMYSLPASAENGISNPAYLEDVAAFSEWLRSQPGVTQVTAISDLVKRLNQAVQGPSHYSIPGDGALTAQYLLLYELSLPLGLDINTLVDVSRSQTLVLVRIANVGSDGIRKLGQAGEEWLRQNAPDRATQVTGLSTMYAHISERNLKSMTWGLLLVLLAISLALLAALRHIRIGLISLIPNLAPAIIAFGCWGITVGDVNLAVSIVGAMTLGIVVDDTVHFLSKYLWARRTLKLTPSAAIEQTFRIVGPALFLTTVALVAGFSVLLLSGFAISSQMGALTALTLCCALATDLLFLPGLVLWVERRQESETKTGKSAWTP